MPITVVYLHDYDFQTSEAEFMGAINPHVARWSGVFMIYDDLNRDPQAWEWSELPKLHTLDITSNSIDYERAPILLSDGKELPNLRVARFLDIPLRWDPGQLAELQELEIIGYNNPSTTPTTSQLLQLLTGMPRLESLILLDVAMLADNSFGLSVNLPYLSNLQLDAVPLESIKQILLSTQLPQCSVERMDRKRTHRLPSKEDLNDTNKKAHYPSDFDVLEFRDNGIGLCTGRFGLSISSGLWLDVVGCMDIVLGRFTTELTASQGIQAKIGTMDRLTSPVIALILDRLNQYLSLRAVQMIQSSQAALLTVIGILGQPKVLADGVIWHFPHLENILIDVEHPPFLELGEVFRERRQAAATSGYPCAIKELHISPLHSRLEQVANNQVDRKTAVELDKLQDALGGGRLYWRSRLWKTCLDKRVPESAVS